MADTSTTDASTDATTQDAGKDDTGKGTTDAGKATDTGTQNGTAAEQTDADIEAIASQAQNPDAVRNALKSERSRAKEARDELEAERAKVKKFEDRDKSEQEKQAEKLTEAEKRATTSEAKLLRFEIAAEAGIPLKHAHRLQGDTKAQLKTDAEELAKELRREDKPSGDADGGKGEGGEGKTFNDMLRRGQ